MTSAKKDETQKPHNTKAKPRKIAQTGRECKTLRQQVRVSCAPVVCPSSAKSKSRLSQKQKTNKQSKNRKTNATENQNFCWCADCETSYKNKLGKLLQKWLPKVARWGGKSLGYKLVINWSTVVRKLDVCSDRIQFCVWATNQKTNG